MDFRVGCSGWSYRHWRGDFYPGDLAPGRWLEHYCQSFDTVELNASFYRLPAASTVRGWRDRTPEGFTFAVKVSQLITHAQRFRGVEDLLAHFLERMRGLGDRLGPLLHQAPPTLGRDGALLAAYLDLLPRDLVHAFEFRNASWWDDSIFALLRDRGASFVVFNMGEVTTPVVATAPDAYVRLHGPGAAYGSSYTDDQLRAWVDRIRGLGAARAWVYFNNDVGGHAPRNARRMIELARSG